MRVMMLGMLVLFVGGCATASLEMYSYDTKEGVVSYQRGVGEGSRKTEAEQIMREQCKGEFEITHMLNKNESAGSFAQVQPNATGGAYAIAGPMQMQKTYLAFRCKPTTAPGA
jgi:hypothetical protein